jgi:hypothetical protein
MDGIGGMKSEGQAPATNLGQKRQEMIFRVKQEGIVIPGNFGNSAPFVPIDKFFEDVFRLSAAEARFQEA